MTAPSRESYIESFINDYEQERNKRGIAFGKCFCGCNQPTTIATKDSRLWKDVKGHPKRFIQYHHYRKFHYPSEIDRTIYEDNGVKYMLIPLSQNLFARVSPHRFDWLMKWSWYAVLAKNTQTYYAARKETLQNGKRIIIQMQRQILGLSVGDLRQGDHINRSNTLDNTDENLRIANFSQQQSHKRLSKKNTTGYRGVTKDGLVFAASIGFQNRKIKLGRRANPADAAALYDIAATILHGEFAELNFPLRALTREEIEAMKARLERPVGKQCSESPQTVPESN